MVYNRAFTHTIYVHYSHATGAMLLPLCPCFEHDEYAYSIDMWQCLNPLRWKLLVLLNYYAWLMLLYTVEVFIRLFTTLALGLLYCYAFMAALLVAIAAVCVLALLSQGA